MLGAIVGDTVGSVYEWHNIKTTEFPLFSDGSTWTDDTVMTVAVAHALLDCYDGTALSETGLVQKMQSYGRMYSEAGYGGKFRRWIKSPYPKPYNSFGNGSAMRVSPVAWVSDDLAHVEELAKQTAEVTHNHPEGIKGAQATAACILMARQGASNDEIRAYVEERYEYYLGFKLDDIRPLYAFDVSCQGSVPQAIVAFLEGEDFEGAIRRAVSIGGDSDTIAAIAGSIAQARYGIPGWIAEEADKRLTGHLRSIVSTFCQRFGVPAKPCISGTGIQERNPILRARGL